MKKWIYGIFFLLAAVLPSNSWACVEEEAQYLDECELIFEHDPLTTLHLDDCEEDTCPCDLDPDDEEHSSIPEEAGVVVKRNWQQIICLSIYYVTYNGAVTTPEKHTFCPSQLQHPPKPAYYNFIFRYSPF